MDSLPLNDIPMLVSAINFLLRDEEFDDLDQICAYYDLDRPGLESRLEAEGYIYSEEYKKFY